jgi:hypothetical protein
VVKGSRLYAPVPHLGLNDSQNFAYDLGDFFQSPRYHLLPALLAQPESATAQRALPALAWFNRANAIDIDDDTAIINLSVAFETLLALPKDAKTDRFVDAVSLLLGRVERLDLWAEQFYDARSDVIHQGKTKRLRFEPQKKKGQPESALYQSHLAYGRQIFQLCVGVVIFGANVTNEAGIAEKLVTNQERLESICKTLDDDTLKPAERFATINETVALIDRYRFVGETGLLIKTLLGAVQRAAKTLLLCSDTLDPVLKQRVEALANAPQSDSSYETLAALRDLHEIRSTLLSDPQSPPAITLRLAEVVWYYTGMRYFGLIEQRKKNPGQKAGT